jgi:hypothetical protein
MYRIISTTNTKRWIWRMLAEIANALFVTYVATEYGTPLQDNSKPWTLRRQYPSTLEALDRSEDRERNGSIGGTHRCCHKLQRLAAVGAVVLVVNICDDIAGLGIIFHALTELFVWWHLPKAVLIVPGAYLGALYVDCRWSVARVHTQQRKQQQQQQQHPKLSFAEFLPRVARLFLQILPIYPVGAVLISFGFMFVIALFDLLHWPVSVLNWPVYYGTLYGPFSYIYYVTKRDVVRESIGSATTLPLAHCMAAASTASNSDADAFAAARSAMLRSR